MEKVCVWVGGGKQYCILISRNGLSISFVATFNPNMHKLWNAHCVYVAVSFIDEPRTSVYATDDITLV